MRRRRRAATALAKLASEGVRGNRKCIGGVNLREVAGGRRVSAAAAAITLTPKMRSFSERTRQIAAANKFEADARRRGEKWYETPVPRVARPAPARGVRAQGMDLLELPDQVSVVIFTPTPLRINDSPRFRILRATFASARACHVIIVDTALAWEKCETWEIAVLLVYAVGLGKIVVAHEDWVGERPWEGPRAMWHYPASKSLSAILVVGSHVQRHSNCMRALQSCASAAGSKWQVVHERPDANDGAEVVDIDGLADLRQFLLRRRRFASGKAGERGHFEMLA